MEMLRRTDIVWDSKTDTLRDLSGVILFQKGEFGE